MLLAFLKLYFLLGKKKNERKIKMEKIERKNSVVFQTLKEKKKTTEV